MFVIYQLMTKARLKRAENTLTTYKKKSRLDSNRKQLKIKS